MHTLADVTFASKNYDIAIVEYYNWVEQPSKQTGKQCNLRQKSSCSALNTSFQRAWVSLKPKKKYIHEREGSQSMFRGARLVYQ